MSATSPIPIIRPDDTRSTPVVSVHPGDALSSRQRLVYVLVLGALIYFNPELILSMVDPITAAQFEHMYSDAAESIGRKRDAGDDWAMFGYYIQHNIGIGFQCFAAGLFAGIGSLFFLAFNGAFIGGMVSCIVVVFLEPAGHLLRRRQARRFQAHGQAQRSQNGHQRGHRGVLPRLEPVDDFAHLAGFLGQFGLAQTERFPPRAQMASQVVWQSDGVSHDLHFWPIQANLQAITYTFTVPRCSGPATNREAVRPGCPR